MASPKSLNEQVSVGPQVHPDELADLVADGFTSIINNRPDDEEPGQPSSNEIAEAAHAAGLRYLHAPVRGVPNEQAVVTVAKRLKADKAEGARTFLFCRSGMRSAATWAMAQRLDGADVEDLRQAAANAGYDLSRLPL